MTRLEDMQDCAEMCAEREIDMTQEKIKEIIEKHALWLKYAESGERANLSGADLRGANLSGANLRGAKWLQEIGEERQKGE